MLKRIDRVAGLTLLHAALQLAAFLAVVQVAPFIRVPPHLQIFLGGLGACAVALIVTLVWWHRECEYTTLPYSAWSSFALLLSATMGIGLSDQYHLVLGLFVVLAAAGVGVVMCLAAVTEYDAQWRVQFKGLDPPSTTAMKCALFQWGMPCFVAGAMLDLRLWGWIALSTWAILQLLLAVTMAPRQTRSRRRRPWYEVRMPRPR